MSDSQSNHLLVPVGHVNSAHSLKGELYIRLNAGKADWLEKLANVYLVSPKGDEMRARSVPSNEAAPYRESVDAVLAALGTDAHRGLSETEAQSRIQRYGRNELTAGGGGADWQADIGPRRIEDI